MDCQGLECYQLSRTTINPMTHHAIRFLLDHIGEYAGVPRVHPRKW